MRPGSELFLKWIANGLPHKWSRQRAIWTAADLVDNCLDGIEPDWRGVKAALEVYAADPDIRQLLSKLDVPDMDERAGRYAQRLADADRLREQRRQEYDAALRYIAASEPDELNGELGLGYTGLDGAERREWRGVPQN